MRADEIEGCLDVGRDALVLLAELVVNGDRTRAEAYARARAEADALISLLDEAPESEHEKIHALLDRYDTLMAGLVRAEGYKRRWGARYSR